MSTYPGARLHYPHRNLAACIHVGVERDTRGVTLQDEQRLNFYPASPLAVISWIFHGRLQMVSMPSDGAPPVLSEALPKLVFSGPSRLPPVSWSAGAVHAISIGLYPDALSALGVQARDYMDAVLPVEDVLPEAVCRTLEQVQEGEGELFQRVECALASVFESASYSGSAMSMNQWLTHLRTRLACSRAGIGLRQMQRQIKRWAGQSHRDLELYVRAERAFALVQSHDAPVWSDIALQAGYSDQSHFGREVKRVSGFAPAQLARRMQVDEAFWMYRLLGER